MATQIAVARRITGDRDVSDVMLCGMLRKPIELHLADDAFGPPQLQSRMLEAADELEKRADRIAELERENEALRKDAARYRWLRRGEYPLGFARLVLNDTPLGIDSTIDAALKEQSKC